MLPVMLAPSAAVSVFSLPQQHNFSSGSCHWSENSGVGLNEISPNDKWTKGAGHDACQSLTLRQPAADWSEPLGLWAEWN